MLRRKCMDPQTVSTTITGLHIVAIILVVVGFIWTAIKSDDLEYSQSGGGCGCFTLIALVVLVIATAVLVEQCNPRLEEVETGKIVTIRRVLTDDTGRIEYDVQLSEEDPDRHVLIQPGEIGNLPLKSGDKLIKTDSGWLRATAP
jgi:hypothetical protein